MDIGFVAVKTFIPSQNYINWSKLDQVKEIISIDCALCPRILQYRQDDYRYMLWMEEITWTGFLIKLVQYRINKY